MFSRIERKIRIVVVVFLLPLLATAQIFPRQLKEDELLGKVKTLTIITNDETREIYMYDIKGNQTERWFFKPMEVLIYRHKAVYNEKGQLLEETKFDKGITPVTKYVYGYDEKGLKIGRSLFSENNSLLEKYIYQYDTAKRMTDSIRVDQNGEIIEKTSSRYDKMGRRIFISHFNNAIGVPQNIEYKYDSSGKLSSVRFLKDSALTSEILFIYKQEEEERRMYGINGKLGSVTKIDSNKKVTSVVYFTEKGESQSKLQYIYDRSGNMLEEIKSDGKDNVATRLLYKYDSSSNKVQTTRHYEQAKVDMTVNWQYEYDKKGNWIKRIQSADGRSGETIRREIEYY